MRLALVRLLPSRLVPTGWQHRARFYQSKLAQKVCVRVPHIGLTLYNTSLRFKVMFWCFFFVFFLVVGCFFLYLCIFLHSTRRVTPLVKDEVDLAKLFIADKLDTKLANGIEPRPLASSSFLPGLLKISRKKKQPIKQEQRFTMTSNTSLDY